MTASTDMHAYTRYIHAVRKLMHACRKLCCRSARYIVIAGWLTGCGTTRTYIDTAPEPDEPVVVVEGQQAGSYEQGGVKVTWDSRRTGMVDRLFDVLFLGAAQGSK